MEKEATKFFEIFLKNSDGILKELRMQFYKLLDFDGKTILPNKLDNERLLEQIKSSIETFNFNIQEIQFLSLIQEIIKEELQKVMTNRNYELFGNNLINRLKSLSELDISLEDDFKDLSRKIASNFHTQEEYYNYLIARQENITSMIKSYNNSVLNALVNLTPKLIIELKLENEKTATVSTHEVVTKSDKTQTDLSNLNNTPEPALLKRTIDMCQEKKRELDAMFRNPNYSSYSSSIAKASRQLATLIEELLKGTHSEQLVGLSDITIESFIAHKIPAFEEIKKLDSSEKVSLSSRDSDTIKQDVPTSGKEYEEQYLKKKEELINNWINSTTMDFANKIYKTYPYSYADADVSSYKEHFKSIYNIPRYPISDKEWDMIIERINEKLYSFVDALIKEERLKRGETITPIQEQTERQPKIHSIETTTNVEKIEINTNTTSKPAFDGKSDEDLSMMISSEIKMDLVFDLIERYNQGMSFIPITAVDLMSKYNMNEKIAQQLVTEINTMVKNYIKGKEQAKVNYQPYVLDSFDEENNEMHP